MAEKSTSTLDRLGRIQNQHFDCFADLAKAADEAGGGGDWARVLDDELPNLRSALEWGIATNRPETAALATSLEWFWTATRRFREGRDLLDRALDIPDLRVSDRIDALLAAGSLAWDQGDLASTRAYSEAARQSATSERDLSRQARACHQLGYTLYSSQLAGPAAEVFSEALGLADHLGLSDRASAMRGLGWARSVEGDYATGVRLHREARELLEEANHGDLAAHCSTEVNFLVQAGEVDEALGLAARVVDLARAGGQPSSLLPALDAYANAAGLVGDFGLRRRILEEGVSVARAIGHPKEAFFHESIAADAVASGDLSGATDALDRGWDVLEGLETLSLADIGVRNRILALRGHLAEDRGDLEVAENLYREVIGGAGRSRLQGEVLAELARMLEDHGDHSGARLAQSRAIEWVDPNDQPAVLDRRSDMAVLEDDLDEALRLRTEARDLLDRHGSPTRRAAARRRRAEVLVELGRLLDALAELDAAVLSERLKSPEIERLHLERARVLVALQDAGGARAEIAASEPLARSAWAADQLHLATAVAGLALLEGRSDSANSLWGAVENYRAANRRLPPRLARRFESPLRELGSSAAPSPAVPSSAESGPALAALRVLVHEEVTAAARPRP